MCKKEKLAFGIALLAAATSCSVDEITIPAEELIHREFIKSYGQIDPNHDWSVIKSSNITVTSPQEADVRVFARDKNGKTIIVADYHDFSGTETIHFDVPKEVESVYVQSGTQFHTVTLGESVSLSPARSRAIDGKDSGILDYVSSRDSVFGYMWEHEYVKAFAEVIGEGEAQKNLDKDNIITDFSFIASDQPFVFYPMYWNTGAHNVLGVYWYENGELKTRDIFQNRLVNGWDKKANSSNPHNMYRRAKTAPNGISITPDKPKDGSADVNVDGIIELSLSNPVMWTELAQATLSSESGASITLDAPKMSDNGKKASFSYSGLNSNTKYTFNLAENAFKLQSSQFDLKTPALEFNFTTISGTPNISSISPDFKSPIPLSGTITVTYDREIISNDASPKAIVTPVDNTEASMTISEGTVSGKSLIFTYSTSSLNTQFKLTIPAGAVSSKDFNAPSDSEQSFTFTTVSKSVKYDETATILKFSEPTHNATVNDKNITRYETGDTVASDNNVTVSIITTDESTCTKKTNQYSYDIPGYTESQLLTPQIQSKSDKKPSAEYSLGNGPQGGNNAVLQVEINAEMLLSVYCHKSNSSPEKINLHLFRHSDSNDIVPSTKLSSADDNYTLNYHVTRGTYTLCFDNSGGGIISGLSYQLAHEFIPDNEQVNMSTRYLSPRIRVQSRADNSTNNSEQFLYTDTIAAKNAGFARSLDNSQSSYVSNNGPDGGEDDIVTHRISINLPKGTVFGFYIRNNHGADNVTNRKDPNDTSEKPNGNAIVKPYTNYSMSNLNQELENSFFNSLDETKTGEYDKYKDGWGKDKTSYLTKTERKFSTAATYVAQNDCRYFSFEDWVDADLNDIVFMVAPESDNEIIDLEVKTNPYIFAVEDLGATAVTNSDIDFNDAVFGVEHVTTNNSQDYVFVTMLAAGGTLKTQLYFGDAPVDGITNGQSIVHGPHVGTGKRLSHINEWFAVDSHTTTINVGNGGHGFGNLTTVRIPVEKGFTLGAIRGEAGKFSVRVDRPDGQTQVVTRPKAEGLAPQILILPGEWKWPKEGMAIHDAYPGGISYDGTLFGSFADWVQKCYDVTTNSWHENPTIDYVIDNPWKGSQAARDEIKNNSKNN